MELRSTAPVGGALLLHGASDSPYSLRALAERLHRRGFEVLVMRLPGHGTAPVGLTRARSEAWAAAVRIGARHAASRLPPGRPLYLVGFSTGGVLAVEYALARVRSYLLSGRPTTFDVTVLGNGDGATQSIIEHRRRAGANEIMSTPTGLAWPSATFSLSHVALPFPADDPLYGAERPPGKKRPFLGQLAAHGERGVTAVPATALLRLRNNPFFGYLAGRIDAFTEAQTDAPAP